MLATTSADSACITRIGMARLVRLAFQGGDLVAVREKLRRLSSDPAAAMDLAVIEQILGNRELGLEIQAGALEQQRCYRSSGCSFAPRLRVLALAAPMDIGGNTPIEFLLADPAVELKILYVLPGRPFTHLVPDHDVAVVVIPDEDEAAASLATIERLMAVWPRPVINPPAKIVQTDRHRLFPIVQSIPNLIIPTTVRIARNDLAAVARGLELPLHLDFPLIVRPVGSHAGRGLERLLAPVEIATYLEAHPASEFFLSRFVDYSSADGLFRKYRIVYVDGRPFACHMAVADQWAIWYLNADMYASPEKRAEEAAFMTGFDDGFGLRHGAALAAIAERLGLDYFIIDCAETRNGDLLLFEAGTAMIVHDMDPPELYPYKPPQMRRIFAAYVAMLDRRVGAASALAA